MQKSPGGMQGLYNGFMMIGVFCVILLLRGVMSFFREIFCFIHHYAASWRWIFPASRNHPGNQHHKTGHTVQSRRNCSSPVVIGGSGSVSAHPGARARCRLLYPLHLPSVALYVSCLPSLLPARLRPAFNFLSKALSLSLACFMAVSVTSPHGSPFRS